MIGICPGTVLLSETKTENKIEKAAALREYLIQPSPTFWVPVTSFVKDSFSTGS